MSKIFEIQANGFSMTDDKVAVPACRIKAEGWIEASDKLTQFLNTRQLSDDIELITPIDKIDFENN